MIFSITERAIATSFWLRSKYFLALCTTIDVGESRRATGMILPVTRNLSATFLSFKIPSTAQLP